MSRVSRVQYADGKPRPAPAERCSLGQALSKLRKSVRADAKRARAAWIKAAKIKSRMARETVPRPAAVVRSFTRAPGARPLRAPRVPVASGRDGGERDDGGGSSVSDGGDGGGGPDPPQRSATPRVLEQRGRS